MSARTVTTRALRLGLLLVPLLLGACSRGGTPTTTGTPPPATPAAQLPTPIVGSIARQGTPVPVGPAPSPATVDYGTIKLIPQWQGLGVPQYPGATRLDFSAASGSSVSNAGTMLFQTTDPPDRVLAYYLGVLPQSGYRKVNANGLQIVEVSSKATVTVNAVKLNGGSHIIIMVTDPTG